ncbi:large subunit ribosomal protein L51 [Mytilus galloprovincialis]|uniref:Large ribosomal subunit protein mL51 n=2 Tax=Mytilus galloprovincialis TaxID=29158 RepID=A0A8B6FV54_MYTGA|nr:large subunit ribosomal protein L51 [Mytilus galloprovincialis]
MGIIGQSICLLCHGMETHTKQLLNKTSPSQMYTLYKAKQTIPSVNLIPKRLMSSKFKKDKETVHRKDAACIGEGDKMYEPQSPYREHWPRRYGWDNKLFGGGALPKLDEPLKFALKQKDKDYWDKEHALFGQNDYIDILGDGNVRPVDLMKGPSWIRGFKGNEMQRIIRRLQFDGHKLQQLYPTKFHMIQKRLDYLYKHYNLRRSNAIGKGIKRVQK